MDNDITIPYKYNEFKQYLRFELGMSENSVISYLSDIETLYKFYKKDIKEIHSEDIVAFMSFMRKNNQSLETILRRLSGISQYFDFLIIEKDIKVNPVEFIAKPRQWHKLPDFLDFDEVEKLISCDDLSTPVKERNCLIMETLYATGCTSMVTCSLPSSSSLKYCYLPANLRTISLQNKYNVEEIQIEGVSNINSVTMENCNETVQNFIFDKILKPIYG